MHSSRQKRRYQRRTPLSEALAVLPTAEKKPTHQDGRHATQREIAALDSWDSTPVNRYGGLLAWTPGAPGAAAERRHNVLQIPEMGPLPGPFHFWVGEPNNPHDTRGAEKRPPDRPSAHHGRSRKRTRWTSVRGPGRGRDSASGLSTSAVEGALASTTGSPGAICFRVRPWASSC